MEDFKKLKNSILKMYRVGLDLGVLCHVHVQTAEDDTSFYQCLSFSSIFLFVEYWISVFLLLGIFAFVYFCINVFVYYAWCATCTCGLQMLAHAFTRAADTAAQDFARGPARHKDTATLLKIFGN